MTSTPGNTPAAQAGNAGTCQPKCCHCFEPCTDDDVCNPDDDDKVYVCETCITKFYREWHEAEQTALREWLDHHYPQHVTSTHDCRLQGRRDRD